MSRPPPIDERVLLARVAGATGDGRCKRRGEHRGRSVDHRRPNERDLRSRSVLPIDHRRRGQRRHGKPHLGQRRFDPHGGRCPRLGRRIDHRRRRIAGPFVASSRHAIRGLIGQDSATPIASRRRRNGPSAPRPAPASTGPVAARRCSESRPRSTPTARSRPVGSVARSHLATPCNVVGWSDRPFAAR